MQNEAKDGLAKEILNVIISVRYSLLNSVHTVVGKTILGLLRRMENSEPQRTPRCSRPLGWRCRKRTAPAPSCSLDRSGTNRASSS